MPIPSPNPRIAILGSITQDIVASAARLPRPGETITGAQLARYPGGKGANQAFAARRLGAEVSLMACVGDDAAADHAQSLLRAEGVDLSAMQICLAAQTGVALICVSTDTGENQISVAPGANRLLRIAPLAAPQFDGVMCQLEAPLDVLRAARSYAPFLCLNAAPAQALPRDLLHAPDLLIVNETEAAFYGDALHDAPGLVALTLGSDGAVLFRKGEEITRQHGFAVDVKDSTGAGDCFSAALVVAMLRGQSPAEALRFACAAGALACTKPGAQPSAPSEAALGLFLDAQSP